VEELFHKTVNNDVVFPPNTDDLVVSELAKDLISHLLEKDAANRLGTPPSVALPLDRPMNGATCVKKKIMTTTTTTPPKKERKKKSDTTCSHFFFLFFLSLSFLLSHFIILFSCFIFMFSVFFFSPSFSPFFSPLFFLVFDGSQLCEGTHVLLRGD
jgi:hypothetical protein